MMQTVADYWIEQGIEKGIEQGIEEGFEKGVERGLHESILDLLTVRFENVPADMVTQVTAVTDVDSLRQLNRQAILVETLADFSRLLTA